MQLLQSNTRYIILFSCQHNWMPSFDSYSLKTVLEVCFLHMGLGKWQEGGILRPVLFSLAFRRCQQCASPSDDTGGKCIMAYYPKKVRNG